MISQRYKASVNPSVPNLKFVAEVVLDPVTEPVDRRKNIGGGLRPCEGFRHGPSENPPDSQFSGQLSNDLHFSSSTLVYNSHYIIHAGFYPDPASVEQRGVLENPGPYSFQSGVGALWGWVCDAELVEFQIETAQGEVELYRAMHGMERLDTLETCGDTNNGFVLLSNWNRFGDGEHRVTAFVDRIELDRAAVQVTTLGEGDQQEFLHGAEGECVVEHFPYQDEAVTLKWQQASQNFVITDVR